MGMDVPAPILSQYDWCGGTPFEVQKKTAAMCTTNRRGYVLNSMGTGKTRAALWAWDFLNKQGLAGKLLIVAPLSTLEFVWAREVFSTLPGRVCAVLHGTKEKRLKLLADDKTDVFVINHDGVNTIHEQLKKREGLNCLVIDELATYRNGGATRTKKMRVFVEKFDWVWGMTGSPIPNEPTDVWAQASIVSPVTVPKYFKRFQEDLMVRVNMFKWRPKSDAVDKAYNALQPAVRFTLDDIMELPELVERQVDVAMGPEQQRVYTHMKNAAFAQIAQNKITAMNEGAVLNKLLQISCGWVYTRDGEVVPLDNDNRVTRLVEDVSACANKVIVFAPFVHALAGIEKALVGADIGEVAVISGATPSGQRNNIFNLFQNTERVKILVAHPQCMAHGVTLTAADTIIWYGPTLGLEIFEQANARIRRVGQKHKQLVLMYQGTDVERKTYARLRAKQKTQNTLLDMFAESSR